MTSISTLTYKKGTLIDLPTLIDLVKKPISWRCWDIETKRLCNCRTPADCPMDSCIDEWEQMELGELK